MIQQSQRLFALKRKWLQRLCVDTNYYATFNRENVQLIDIKNEPIETLTEAGLVTGGVEYQFDAIIFATGFDAMTGSLQRINMKAGPA